MRCVIRLSRAWRSCSTAAADVPALSQLVASQRVPVLETGIRERYAVVVIATVPRHFNVEDHAAWLEDDALAGSDCCAWAWSRPPTARNRPTSAGWRAAHRVSPNIRLLCAEVLSGRSSHGEHDVLQPVAVTRQLAERRAGVAVPVGDLGVSTLRGCRAFVVPRCRGAGAYSRDGPLAAGGADVDHAVV